MFKKRQILVIIWMIFGCSALMIEAKKDGLFNVNLNISDETVQKAVAELKAMAPVLSEHMKPIITHAAQELRQSGPELIDKFNKTTLPALSKELKEIAPGVEKNITKVCDQFIKTLKMVTHPLRVVPIVGVGLAGAVAAIMMLKKGVETYIDGSMDQKIREKGKYLIISGLIGLGLSGLLIGKSENIVNYIS